MKINKKLYSIALASTTMILFLIIVSSTASAAITETQITNHGTASGGYDIYGNTIAWTDWRNGNADIYIYDLSTKTEIHTTNKSDQTNPAIYGNKVVWEDFRNKAAYNSDIYMQDLSTKKQTQITTLGTAIESDIYGNRIVWINWVQGERERINDAYMYDLSTKKQTQITTSGDAHYPAIYEDKIVWEDRNDIYMGTITYVDTILKTSHVSNLSDDVTTGANVEQKPEQIQSSDTSGKGSTKASGFGIVSVITCLLGAFLYK
jgi:beta propeller repeat protein